MPTGGARDIQFNRVVAALDRAAEKAIDAPFVDVFAYVDENGVVRAEKVCATNDNVMLLAVRAGRLPN